MLWRRAVEPRASLRVADFGDAFDDDRNWWRNFEAKTHFSHGLRVAMPAKATAQKTMAGASVFDPTTAKCGLVDGGEADGVASSNEMLELMNNHALLMQSSTGGKSLLMYVPWASRARLSTGPPIALALLTE
jgi:hypothetical protein